MHRTVPSRLATITLVAALGVTLAGCGDADSDPGASSSSGGADGAGDNDPGTAPEVDGADLPEICDLVTAAEVGAVLGGTVELAPGPVGPDCEFTIPDDLRAYSGSLGALSVDTGNGGFEALAAGSAASLDDPVDHDLEVGEEGYVTTGTVFGGENLQASGGALVDGVAYTVTVVQGAGHTEDELVDVTERLLSLVLDKL